MRGIKILTALAVTLGLLAGCATFTQNLPVEQLVVEFATLKTIEQGKTTADRQTRAARIVAIATGAKTIVDTGNTTVAALQAAIEARVAKLGLSPADSLLAEALVQAVIAEVNKRVTSGVLSPDTAVQVDTVLGWVITTASAPVS